MLTVLNIKCLCLVPLEFNSFNIKPNATFVNALVHLFNANGRNTLDWMAPAVASIYFSYTPFHLQM